MSSPTKDIPGDESGLVARLTLEQKVRLLTGADSWKLYGEGSVGLRPMVLSDGPAGGPGARFDAPPPPAPLPPPLAPAATRDGRPGRGHARAPRRWGPAAGRHRPPP